VVSQFQVSRACIGCGRCCGTAPRHFQIDPAVGQSSVVKQPTSPAETRQCLEALKGCPVQAIGEKVPTNRTLTRT
jgi:ferredoxin